MTDQHDPVTAHPGSPHDRSAAPSARPGGSKAAGVLLGVALALLAPLALMSQHLGTLFGGEVTLYRVVLTEMVVPLLVWIVVCAVLIARVPWRRMGVGVLAGGALPALLLVVFVLPPLVRGTAGAP